MNILSVGETEIVLNGFSEIKKTVFFIFRNNGIVITTNPSGIYSKCLEFSVVENKITDGKLIEELNQRGFLSDHAFIEHAGDYFSGNPN